MTEVEKWLKETLKVAGEAKKLKRKINYLNGLLIRTSRPYDVPIIKGGQGLDRELVIDDITTCEKRLKELEAIKKENRELIANLKNEKIYQLINLRHIEGYSWQKTADLMNFTWGYVKGGLLKRAKKQIETLLKLKNPKN